MIVVILTMINPATRNQWSFMTSSSTLLRELMIFLIITTSSSMCVPQSSQSHHHEPLYFTPFLLSKNIIKKVWGSCSLALVVARTVVVTAAAVVKVVVVVTITLVERKCFLTITPCTRYSLKHRIHRTTMSEKRTKNAAFLRFPVCLIRWSTVRKPRILLEGSKNFGPFVRQTTSTVRIMSKKNW